jgi:hypothetical protein
MMSANDDLLNALWQAIERAAQVEAELQVMAEQLTAWRAMAEAAMQALDREIAGRDGRRANE